MCEVFFMNKVFKVIWSEARNAYVVVSEMAKNHGTKSCSTKKLLAMLIATGVMTCASVAPVMAAPTVDDSAKVNVGKKAEVNVGENAKVNVNKNAELTLNNGAKVKLGEDAKVEVDKIVAIGNAVSATGGDSVAVGNGAKAEGANGIAIGYKSLSGEKGWGVAVGGNTQATGTFSVALGQTAKALEVEGIAIGHTSLSEGSGAIAIGKKTNAKGAASLALGNDAKALEEASIAFGQGSESNGNASIAVGRQAKATGANSIAIGNQAVAAQDNSVVIGAHTYNKTTGTGVTGVGEQTQVLGDYSAAFGMKASANKSFTSAIGSSAKATADCANAFGSNSTASAVWSVALGTNSVADRTSGYVGLYAPEDTNSLTWRANGGAVSVGSNGTLTRQITNVAAGTEDTDAVNVAQLRRAMENVNIKFEAGNGIVIETVKSNDGTTYKISTNIVGSDTKTDTTTVTPSASGDGGTIGGDTENIVPNPGSNTLSNQPAADNNIQTGDPVKIETVTKPTNFAADEGDALAISPSETLGIKGDEKKNITTTTTTNADGKYIQVTLNQDLNVNSVTADSVAANTFKAGATTITNNGLTIEEGPSVTKNGIDAGGKKITNVAQGDLSKTSMDAVNGSQLHETNINVANNSMRINKLGDRVNKVGAGAAALAALHPMDFDPDDKLTFSAGYGNYGGENAAAIGAYYRPDEKVMFSVAGTVGNGENMVNAGVSFALDRTNHVSNSRTALAREVIDLRGQLAVMGAKMAKMEKAFGMLDETKTKLFPDVPANHWAYEYIAKLAGNGYIEGYPDGNFGGDRLMTRYEFAAMLYRAIEKGAALEEKIIKEFEPELGRIRVDRISGEDGDRDKIERVRVNDTKGERDHYGNKLAK